MSWRGCPNTWPAPATVWTSKLKNTNWICIIKCPQLHNLIRRRWASQVPDISWLLFMFCYFFFYNLLFSCCFIPDIIQDTAFSSCQVAASRSWICWFVAATNSRMAARCICLESNRERSCCERCWNLMLLYMFNINHVGQSPLFGGNISFGVNQFVVQPSCYMANMYISFAGNINHVGQPVRLISPNFGWSDDEFRVSEMNGEWSFTVRWLWGRLPKTLHVVVQVFVPPWVPDFCL